MRGRLGRVEPACRRHLPARRRLHMMQETLGGRDRLLESLEPTG